MITWFIAGFAALAGAAAAPLLVSLGLRQLGPASAPAHRFTVEIAAVGAISGGCAAVAACRAASWWWLPALFVWAVALAAAATCDARIQRIPTPLTRTAALTVLILLAMAASASLEVRGLVVSVVAAVCAAFILGACWRFLGAGFGDVRLAGLGGLGLGHATALSLTWGIGTFAIIVIGQAIITFATTHDRRAQVPFGPALAVGFLLAAV